MVAVGLTGLAGLVFYAKGRDVWGGYSLSRASDALNLALVKDPGAERNKALASGAASAQSGISVTPDDPRLWNTIAEIRLEQAMAGGAGAVSPTMLLASAGASEHAAKLSPRDGAAQARLAYVKSLQRDAEASATALTQSYDADFTVTPAYAQRRLETSGRAWNAMDDSLRNRVMAEACAVSTRSEEDRAQVQRLRMSFADVGMAIELDRVLADPACGGTPVAPVEAAGQP